MRIILFAAALMAITGSPVVAREFSENPDEIAVQEMHNYGGCVAERSPRLANELLRLDYRTEDYGENLQRLAHGHRYCLATGRLAFDGLLFTGALAEQLLEGGRRSDEVTVLLAKVPNPPIQARDETEMMALCTVRNAPVEVTQLFKQPVASDDEAKAIQALTPTLGACLAKDQSLQVNRPGLRAILALAAWRIANGSGN